MKRGYAQLLQSYLRIFPCVALLGVRQCGKTTLAKRFAAGSQSYFDLEDPLDLARLEAPQQ